MLPQSMRVTALERALGALDRLARRRGRGDEAAHLAVGMRGEDAAFFDLLRKGYTVVARRWSSGTVAGDVDLIAWEGDRLCFFEVKTRTERDATPAEAAVDRHKRFVLRRLARAYLRQIGGETPAPVSVRFDVISVYLAPGRTAEIEHFEDAFGWREG
jgi:putative endonuclease